MRGLMLALKPYTQTSIFMSTKKDLDFLLKVKSAVREHDPKVQFKMCFMNYSNKILTMFAQITPRELIEDQNLNNYEQQELLFSQLRSLCFLPYLYIKFTLDLIKDITREKRHRESMDLLDQF